MFNYFKKQKQTDCYVDKKALRQITTFRERFQDQVVALFRHLSNVSRMAAAPHLFEEDIVDISTDCLMDSMNAFAQNCYDLHKEKDSEGLDLARQMVEKQWNDLPDHFKTQKTMQYREFFEAALTQNRLIQINNERQQSDDEKKLKHKALKNPNNLNDAYSHLIRNIVKSEKKTDGYNNNTQINDELQREHQQKLKEYRAKHKTNGRKYKDYNASNINTSSFYFTKSGQNAVFTDRYRNVDDEKDAMDDVLMNGTSNKCDENTIYHPQNAVLMLSAKQRINKIDHPIPCQILSKPSKEQQKYNVKLANPFGTELWIDPRQFDIKCVSNDEAYVQKMEMWYMQQYKIKNLGYLAVDGVNVDADDDDVNMYDSRRSWINQLDVKCKVDAFDGTKWFPATVIQIKRNQRNQVKVHYDGFKKQYDEWVNVWDQKKIAPHCTRTTPAIY